MSVNCPWCKECKTLTEIKTNHAEKFTHSPNICPLDYHFNPVPRDGERVSSKKPDLDDYDRWHHKQFD